MAKTIIIETPTNELDMYNLTNEYNDMRASARKRAITAMFENRACSHGYILVGNAWYRFNGDKCIRMHGMDICEYCHKEMKQEEQAAEPEQIEAAPELDTEAIKADIKAYEQEYAYDSFIARAAVNLNMSINHFKSWQELEPEDKEDFLQKHGTEVY